ncbi:hypothetical protein, partial [Sphingopyxis sp.]|uniref:hypothetical protein n=1 Tax=Sphingopyxis sp. TaxID=1908224 RepID=UPI002D808206
VPRHRVDLNEGYRLGHDIQPDRIDLKRTPRPDHRLRSRVDLLRKQDDQDHQRECRVHGPPDRRG